ncbi:MAG: hypothetical protein FJ299_08710 [Planctomycetes bacterium]|nr:hypothetical protein [Planctomycetota bacterium]
MSASSPPRLGAPAALAITATALLSQAWIVELPFQLDDHLVLADPIAHFGASTRAAASEAGDAAPTMLRWTLWALWALLAEFSPGPLSPLLYHACGLALHALTSVLVGAAATRLVAQRVAPARPWLPGLVAGAGFALSVGAIEAVAWPSAWGDALAVLLACAALIALLRANAAQDCRRARAGWLALGGLSTILCLLAKESALVLPPTLALALAASGARRARAEQLVLAAALGVVLLLRVLVLGGLNLGYPGGAPLTPALLAESLGPVLRGFLQALQPWNRAPELADQLPGGVRLHLGTALLAPCLLVALLAWARHGRPLRAPVLALLALALLLAPTALIATGDPTNVLSRAQYAPLAWVWIAAGATLGALLALDVQGARFARSVAGVTVLLLFSALLNLRAHVVATTRLACAEIHALDRCVAEARAEHARSGSRLPLVLIHIAGEPGLGGIPVLGTHASLRYAPPFTPGPAELGARAHRLFSSPALRAAQPDGDAAPPDFELLSWGTRAECEREWPWAALAARDLVWIGPSGDALAALARGATPSELRAARLPRARSALIAGLGDERRAALTWRTEPAAAREHFTRHVPSSAIPAHALGALDLAFEPGPRATVALELEAGKRTTLHAFTLARVEQQTRRVALGRPADLEWLFGPPVHAFALGPAAAPELSPPQVPGPALAYQPRALAAPPHVLVIEPSDELELSAQRPPRLVLGSRAPPLESLFARLELALQLPVGRIAIHARTSLSRFQAKGANAAEHALEADLDSFRFDAWPPELPSLPWSEFHAQWLAPQAAQRGRSEFAAAARVVLIAGEAAQLEAGGGLVVGASAWRRLRLRL